MPWRRSEINAKQASIALCLYAVSFLAFLMFWVNAMVAAAIAPAYLFAAITLWLLTGFLAVRTQFSLINPNAWKAVPACQWEEHQRDRMITTFILWNIANIAALALDAALRKTGAEFVVYPWFMLFSITAGYGALMRRCAALAFPPIASTMEQKE